MTEQEKRWGGEYRVVKQTKGNGSEHFIIEESYYSFDSMTGQISTKWKNVFSDLKFELLEKAIETTDKMYGVKVVSNEVVAE